MASRTKPAELRFKPIAAGLRKLGLNPEAVLGSTWQGQIKGMFSNADRAAASALARNTAPARYIAVIHPAGDAVSNVEDQTAVVAPTLSALLAHFFNVSAEFCTGPDRVVFDPSEERIELYLRGRPLVTMQPLRFSKVSEQLMDQVDAVFSRPGGDGTESDRKYATYVEYTIARTTGLHNIGLNADFLDLEQPSADKWLRVGASLCRRLGGDAADLHLVQKITALALEVSCWDVVAKSTEDVALACGPWYMKSSEPAAEPVGIYASHRHAMAALLEALTDNRFGTGQAPYLRVGSGEVNGLPPIWVRNRRPSPDLKQWWSLPGAEISACDTAESIPRQEELAEHLLESKSSAAIEEGFRVRQCRKERIGWHDAYHFERPVLEAADWRFTVENYGKPKYMMARQLDGTGRAIFEAFVPVRGGFLAFIPELDAHVLHDRDFGELFAVMQGLDSSAERLLQQTLGAGHKPCPRMEVDDLDRTDLDEILEMMDKVRQTQL